MSKDIRVVFTGLLFGLPLMFFVGCSDNPSSHNNPGDLETISPEAAGYSSAALDSVTQALEQSGFSAMMALHDGKVFFSWGDITRNYKCHSIRKPFLSALIGIYVNRGVINLNATMAELDIDDIPPSLTSAEKQATVRQLMQSRSGIYHEAAAEDYSMIASRPERGSHAPGTYFYYNNWDFNALGTIFNQRTGSDIYEEFKTLIADPLGMQDFYIDSCYYQYELEKSSHPAYHFRMSARDMARFGVLYQKNGIWNGTRIIPSQWISESTAPYSILDSASGVSYGYMWTVIPDGSNMADMIGYSGYYHTGVGVHALIIIPEIDLVIVQRYDTEGTWVDPGETGMQIGIMLMNAKTE